MIGNNLYDNWSLLTQQEKQLIEALEEVIHSRKTGKEGQLTLPDGSIRELIDAGKAYVTTRNQAIYGSNVVEQATKVGAAFSRLEAALKPFTEGKQAESLIGR